MRANAIALSSGAHQYPVWRFISSSATNSATPLAIVSLPSWVSWASSPLVRSITHRLRARMKLAKPPRGEMRGSVAKPLPLVSLRTAVPPALSRSWKYSSPPSGNSNARPLGAHW